MRLLMPTAHPTLSQLFENAVMGNRFPDHVASRRRDPRRARKLVPVREMVNLPQQCRDRDNDFSEHRVTSVTSPSKQITENPMRRTRGRQQLVGILALLFAPSIQALAQA